MGVRSVARGSSRSAEGGGQNVFADRCSQVKIQLSTPTQASNIMPFKRKDDPPPDNLFVNEQGEPMCFFVRPGPLKQELLPLITAGGGLLCNVQKSGSILLKDPEERASLSDSTSHWYVSTKYIQDCIEKKEKLNIEDYRLTQESTNSAKTKTRSKVGSPAISGGRAAYTPEEDEAILNYVSKHVKEIGGNKLWQEMEKQQVTSHSWQSMKYRYRVQLAARLFEYKPADTEKEDKAQNTEQTEPEIKTEGSESPQNISAETEDPKTISSDIDLTQVSQSSDSQEEQTEAQPAKSRDTEMCDSMETSKSEIDETQNSSSLQQTTAKSAPNSNTNTSPSVVNRPVTRKQVELENMPYVKKLRSGASPGASPGSLFKWPKLLSKSKSASSPKRDPKEALAPPKKVRKKTESSVSEQIQEETQQSDPSEPTQTDEGNSSAAQPTEKKTVKRKLGILEMATKEFEDDSESGSDLRDETPGPSTSIEAVAGSSNSPNPSTAVSENQENEVAPAQPEQNPQTTSTTTTNNTTAVTSPAPDKASASDPVTSEPHISETTSKAHLFIFENESQELEEEDEEETQCLEAPGTSAADQTNQPRNSPSLTQDQLEEDVKLLKDCMQQTNQSWRCDLKSVSVQTHLVSVTKALLKASGDVALALEILQNPSSFSGPVWTGTDDQRLCSSDSQIRQDLLTKYGEEGVAKRLMFLEMEV
ncbi:hypothetical protein WMY93_011462 [Mugilogobius chulae]|uniref:Telomeric repeat-binding factor 2-interacting protein 1 n=1 Tax=Mugilogobius chulae TaxID=88201 RepID=A0AAW0P5Z2_9GOBI